MKSTEPWHPEMIHQNPSGLYFRSISADLVQSFSSEPHVLVSSCCYLFCKFTVKEKHTLHCFALICVHWSLWNDPVWGDLKPSRAQRWTYCPQRMLLAAFSIFEFSCVLGYPMLLYTCCKEVCPKDLKQHRSTAVAVFCMSRSCGEHQHPVCS